MCLTGFLSIYLSSIWFYSVSSIITFFVFFLYGELVVLRFTVLPRSPLRLFLGDRFLIVFKIIIRSLFIAKLSLLGSRPTSFFRDDELI